MHILRVRINHAVSNLFVCDGEMMMMMDDPLSKKNSLYMRKSFEI